ncbi:MAG TPA: ABC transporter permease subunit [Pirellulales bacterium]|jgi:ABC-type transport system involved in multi-copper enzyme maturation permease subunit|nr:ABC transporter permease subunit [Pirellulales bacterium]
MNRGLMLKAAVEIWPSTLLCGSLLFGVEALLAYVLPAFQAQFSESLRQIKFLQTIFGALLGTDVGGELGPEMFMAFPWVHPVVLALVWAHALLVCTRMPAGEIERGTADVIFTLPVTRWEILRSETAVWLVASLAIMAMILLGNLFGRSYAPAAMSVDPERTLAVLVNLWCMYLAVGGLSWLVSAGSGRRGVAITVAFVLLLSSFLLNYLAQFWDVAKRFAFLGLLDYYRPLFILRDGIVPTRDMAVLLVAALVLWIAAGVVFNRRDVCTT